MTKRYLLAASIAALATAPAIAQDNRSTVTQNGDSAEATVLQRGANDRSTITQNSGGSVRVEQLGRTGSTSTVTTGADDRPPESTVLVQQTDNGTSGLAAGQANVSTVIQDNVNGFGASGTGSTVKVYQSHSFANAPQNRSYVEQGRNAVSGQVEVFQGGAAHVSDYRSTTSTDNDANISQRGFGNNSLVEQDFQNAGALAVVDQIGFGAGGNQVIVQQISRGFAPPNPTGNGTFGTGATATARQTGADNYAAIYQTTTADFPALNPTESEATSEQNGSDNDSRIGQFNSNGFADVDQVGTGNIQLLNQFGTDAQARISQTGNGNNSDIAQFGDDAFASVTQNGAGNRSTIDQGTSANGGSMNSATVSQTGNGNVSNITQMGNGNTATVSQGSGGGPT